MIVLDANVLIAHLDERDAQHERAVERLLELAEQPLACSTITLAEVLVGPARHGRLDVARAAIDEIGVIEITLAVDAAERLARCVPKPASSCLTAACSSLRRTRPLPAC